jgi:hypothetical protein
MLHLVQRCLRAMHVIHRAEPIKFAVVTRKFAPIMQERVKLLQASHAPKKLRNRPLDGGTDRAIL